MKKERERDGRVGKRGNKMGEGEERIKRSREIEREGGKGDGRRERETAEKRERERERGWERDSRGKEGMKMVSITYPHTNTEAPSSMIHLPSSSQCFFMLS